jgi:hypothetical protein
MKCPHCGMNIRDNIVVCGYCGGKIAQESEKSPPGAGRQNSSNSSTGQKGAGGKITTPRQEEPETDEEEGGISVYLQPGEQVLIGSLNIAVKKFFFHAYLTNQRIFLIDTQEKKVKVTAKDIPRDTIAGSIIEYSESSDPVLVLSLKSADDEIKTMKLIFIQNGMDRSGEIDEWISLLQEQGRQKKIPAQTFEEIPENLEEPEPVQAEKPLQKQDLQPKRKPGKDHEKQPPVKRHILFHKTQEQVPEVEETPRPPRRAQVREVPEPVKKPATKQESEYEISPVKKADTSPVRKYEVQSAMKVAMKSAMQPLKPSSLQTAKRPVIGPVSPPFNEPGSTDTAVSPGRPPLQEKAPGMPVHDEGAEIPPFCQNCGKKIPPAANFCPGCGTKLGTHRPGSPDSMPESTHQKKATHHEAPIREKKGVPHDEEIDKNEKDDEIPVPTKPPVKKVPKGSEMTILHKFLRR